MSGSIFKEQGDGLWALDARSLSDAYIFSEYYALQRKERKEKIDRLRTGEGKRLSLAAGILTEHVLGLAGCAGAEITNGRNGKPYVSGGKCFFNVSHSKDVAVCAVSDREVGADVEKICDFRESLIRHVFSVNERELVMRMAGDRNDKVKENTFYTLLWTIKESVMKWSGDGLALSPERIHVTVDEGIRVRIDPDGARGGEVSGEKLKISCFKEGDYCISVCSEHNNFTDHVEWLFI